MRSKNTLLIAVAMLLVLAVSATGTLAYLSSRTEKPVVNTFIAAGGGKIAESIDIYENKALKKADGSYELIEATTDKNSYDVLPGVDLPKNPWLTVNKKTSVESYLYLEIVDGLGESSKLSYGVESHWQKLDGVTGLNKGTVYVYAKNGRTPSIVTDKDDLSKLSILTDNKVTVENDNDLALGAGVQLSFYGYLAQASAANGAEAVYSACFNGMNK